MIEIVSARMDKQKESSIVISVSYLSLSKRYGNKPDKLLFTQFPALFYRLKFLLM